MRDIVLQAEEVALVVAALQRRCTTDARLAGGGRRREFGRTPRRQANLERAARGRSRPAVCGSVHVSPGFEWVNPVLSSFEDWVLGWVIQTGLLLLSSF